MSYISAQNVTFAYESNEGEEKDEVLHGVSLDIKKGEFIALLGHNGSGKSTLAKHLNALLLPCGGKVYVDGSSNALRCFASVDFPER